jgi:hypothetical protein
MQTTQSTEQTPRKAYRNWIKGTQMTFWVAQVPGDGGKDWGYTQNSEEGILLTLYWQRRFRCDCERVGYTAQFV